jgi:hypothetical protein
MRSVLNHTEVFIFKHISRESVSNLFTKIVKSGRRRFYYNVLRNKRVSLQDSKANKNTQHYKRDVYL